MAEVKKNDDEECEELLLVIELNDAIEKYNKDKTDIDKLPTFEKFPFDDDQVGYENNKQTVIARLGAMTGHPDYIKWYNSLTDIQRSNYFQSVPEPEEQKDEDIVPSVGSATGRTKKQIPRIGGNYMTSDISTSDILSSYNAPNAYSATSSYMPNTTVNNLATSSYLPQSPYMQQPQQSPYSTLQTPQSPYLMQSPYSTLQTPQSPYSTLQTQQSPYSTLQTPYMQQSPNLNTYTDTYLNTGTMNTGTMDQETESDDDLSLERKKFNDEIKDIIKNYRR